MRFDRRYTAAIFWILIAVVYAIAIMPSSSAPDLGAGDKINHIAAFLTLTMVGRFAYRRAASWRLALGLSLYGAVIELTQAIPALRRDASVWDWAADTAAIFLMLAICRFGERWVPSRAAA